MEKMNSSVCHEAYCDYIKGKYFGILRDCEKKKDYEPLIESHFCRITWCGRRI